MTEQNEARLFRPVFDLPYQRKTNAQDVLREIMDDPYEDAYL